MIKIGLYTASNGQTFDIEYIPEEKNAFAIGPLPEPQGNGVGSRGVYANVFNVSQEEAREMIIQEIEQKVAEKTSEA
jgi:hypothetical protein